MILLPIWGREKITKICFDNLKELQKDFNIDVLCIVSEDWAKLEAFKYGFKQVYASNDDLGEKMNIGIREALDYDFDYLMNLGSDDIITKDLFKCYEPYFKDELKMFGGTRVTFIDSESKEIKKFDYKMMIGAGRCIRRDVLRSVSKGVDLYDKGLVRGLDMNSQSKFIRHSHTEIENPFNSIYDIKSVNNIWTFKQMQGEKVTFDKAVDGLTTKQIDSILEL